MSEVADEPNEYLSHDQERGSAKYRTKFNTKWEGAYPVKRVQSDAYSFWCVVKVHTCFIKGGLRRGGRRNKTISLN